MRDAQGVRPRIARVLQRSAPLGGSVFGLAAAAGVAVGTLAFVTVTHPSQAGGLAVVAVCAPVAVVAAGGLRRFLLLAIVLDIPLQWDINLWYSEAAQKVGTLGGLNISVTTVALAALYGQWIADRFGATPQMPAPAWRSALPLATYVGICALSLAGTQNVKFAGFGLWLLVQTLLLFVYVASTLRTRDELRFILTWMVLALLGESVLICMLRLTGAQFSAIGVASHGDGVSAAVDQRLGGTIGSPNTAASFLCLLLPMTAGLLATPLSRWMRRLCVAALGFGLIALVVTGSRGGLVSLTISAVIIGYVAMRRGFIRPRTALVGLLAAVAIIVPFTPFIVGRIVGNDKGSAHSRITMAELAWDIVREHPLLGVGQNTVGQVIPDYAGPEFNGTFVFTIHNKYLLVWAEAGLLALAAFIWFLASTIRRGVQAMRSSDPLIGPVALGITAGIGGQLVHMGVDIFQSRPQIQLLWFMAALLTAMTALVGLRQDAAFAP